MGGFPSVPRRLSGLKETLEIAVGMFSNERFSARAPVPVMVGGGGEKRTLKYAARWADISHFFVGDVKSLKHKLGVLKEHCAREGTDFDEIVKGTTFRVVLGSESEINEKMEARGKEYHLPVEPMRRRLRAGAGRTGSRSCSITAWGWLP